MSRNTYPFKSIKSKRMQCSFNYCYDTADFANCKCIKNAARISIINSNLQIIEMFNNYGLDRRETIQPHVYTIVRKFSNLDTY